jgi:hypothetical protein
MVEASGKHTRRSFIGKAAAVGAASVAAAIIRPDHAAAADGDAMFVGGDYSSSNPTTLRNSSATALQAVSTTGVGIYASSDSLPGDTAFRGKIGVRAQAFHDDVTSIAVLAETVNGQAVRGEASSGTGGYFTSATGTALQVAGKAKFSRSGRVNVPVGKAYVDITVAGGLSTSAIVLATLQAYRAGVYVAGVRRNYPSAGKARIYLSKVASSTTAIPVGWIVIG